MSIDLHTVLRKVSGIRSTIDINASDGISRPNSIEVDAVIAEPLVLRDMVEGRVKAVSMTALCITVVAYQQVLEVVLMTAAVAKVVGVCHYQVLRIFLIVKLSLFCRYA